MSIKYYEQQINKSWFGITNAVQSFRKHSLGEKIGIGFIDLVIIIMLSGLDLVICFAGLQLLYPYFPNIGSKQSIIQTTYNNGILVSTQTNNFYHFNLMVYASTFIILMVLIIIFLFKYDLRKSVQKAQRLDMNFNRFYDFLKEVVKNLSEEDLLAEAIGYFDEDADPNEFIDQVQGKKT